MSKVKGCGNEKCEAYKKRIKYKSSETYCSRCGDPLFPVCRDCYTILTDESANPCVRCVAKHQDRRNKTLKILKGIGVGALGIAVIILDPKKLPKKS